MGLSPIVGMIHCYLKTGPGEMIEEVCSCCACVNMRKKKQMKGVFATSQKDPGDGCPKIRLQGRETGSGTCRRLMCMLGNLLGFSTLTVPEFLFVKYLRNE